MFLNDNAIDSVGVVVNLTYEQWKALETMCDEKKFFIINLLIWQQ